MNEILWYVGNKEPRMYPKVAHISLDPCPLDYDRLRRSPVPVAMTTLEEERKLVADWQATFDRRWVPWEVRRDIEGPSAGPEFVSAGDHGSYLMGDIMESGFGSRDMLIVIPGHRDRTKALDSLLVKGNIPASQAEFLYRVTRLKSSCAPGSLVISFPASPYRLNPQVWMFSCRILRALIRLSIQSDNRMLSTAIDTCAW